MSTLSTEARRKLGDKLAGQIPVERLYDPEFLPGWAVIHRESRRVLLRAETGAMLWAYLRRGSTVVRYQLVEGRQATALYERFGPPHEIGKALSKALRPGRDAEEAMLSIGQQNVAAAAYLGSCPRDSGQERYYHLGGVGVLVLDLNRDGALIGYRLLPDEQSQHWLSQPPAQLRDRPEPLPKPVDDGSRALVGYRPRDGQPPVEPPLTLLILGEFCDLERLPELGQRPPLPIAPDGLDEAMAKLAPSLPIARVQQTGSEDQAFAGARLRFERLDDMTPAGILRQFPEFARQLEARDAEHLNRRQRSSSDLDRRLSRQVDNVLSLPRYRILEAAWRGLALVLEGCMADDNIEVLLWPCNKLQLRANSTGQNGIGASALLKVLRRSQLAGAPISVVICSFEFDDNEADVALLQRCGQVASRCSVPFLAAGAPALYSESGGQSFGSVSSVGQAKNSPSEKALAALRRSEVARFIGLAAPRVLFRPAFDTPGWQISEFDYRATLESTELCCWGAASYAVARSICDGFVAYGWGAQLGADPRGAISGLPRVAGDGRARAIGPTQVAIGAYSAQRLARSGLMALRYQRGLDSPRIAASCSLCAGTNEGGDSEWSHTFAACRLMQCLALQVQQGELAQVLNAAATTEADNDQLSRRLDGWLQQYVGEPASPTDAPKPLKEGSVALERSHQGYRVTLRYCPANAGRPDPPWLSLQGWLAAPNQTRTVRDPPGIRISDAQRIRGHRVARLPLSRRRLTLLDRRLGLNLPLGAELEPPTAARLPIWPHGTLSGSGGADLQPEATPEVQVAVVRAGSERLNIWAQELFHRGNEGSAEAKDATQSTDGDGYLARLSTSGAALEQLFASQWGQVVAHRIVTHPDGTAIRVAVSVQAIAGRSLPPLEAYAQRILQTVQPGLRYLTVGPQRIPLLIPAVRDVLFVDLPPNHTLLSDEPDADAVGYELRELTLPSARPSRCRLNIVPHTKLLWRRAELPERYVNIRPQVLLGQTVDSYRYECDDGRWIREIVATLDERRPRSLVVHIVSETWTNRQRMVHDELIDSLLLGRVAPVAGPNVRGGKTPGGPRHWIGDPLNVDESEPLMLSASGVANMVANDGQTVDEQALGTCQAELTTEPDPAADPPRPSLAQWSDQYQVMSKLGEGGIGEVFRVVHLGWNLELAVKRPKVELLTHGGTEHLVREAEAWTNLGMHPNVVSCYQVRLLGAVPHVFVELVDGGSLADWIRTRKLYAAPPKTHAYPRRRGRWVLAQIVDVAIQIAFGLHHAHQHGLVHQDVKPSNVLLTPDGIVKVTDFGLVKATAPLRVAGSRADTVLATYAGLTPAYCSPEQAAAAEGHRGTKMTRRTDVWSWAVTVLEMFAGERTWRSGVVAGHVLRELVEGGSDSPEIPPIPAAIAELLRRCFAPDPRDRPQDMLELARELARILHQTTGNRYPRPVPEPADDRANVLNNRGASLMDLGQLEDADKAWLRALNIEPLHIHATYNRGLYRWRNYGGSSDKLVGQLRECLRAHPDSWEAHHMLAWTYIERGDGQAARTELDEARQQLANDGLAQNHITRARRAIRAGFETLGTRRISHNIEALDMSCDATVVVAIGAQPGSHDTVTTLTRWQPPAESVRETTVNMIANQLWVWPDGSQCLLAGTAFALQQGRAVMREQLELWDLAALECRQRIPLEPWVSEEAVATGQLDRKVVRQLAVVLPRGLVSCGFADGHVELWSLTDHTLTAALDGHEHGVTALAPSPDGRLLASASRGDGCVYLWDLTRQCCVQVFESLPELCGLWLGQRVLVAVTKAQAVWFEAATARRIHASNALRGHGVVVADGERFLRAGPAGQLQLWQVANDRCVRQLTGRPQGIRNLVATPDGASVVVAHEDRVLTLWGLTRTRRAPWMVVRPRSSEQLLRDEHSFAAMLARADEALDQGEYGQAVQLSERACSIPGYQRSPELDPLLARLAAKTARGPAAGAYLERTLTSLPYRRVGLTADGTRAIAISQDGQLTLWQLPRGQLDDRLHHDQDLHDAALAADGRIALSLTAGHSVLIWDVRTDRLIASLAERPGAKAIALSADGRIALVLSDQLWAVDLSREGDRRVLQEGHERGLQHMVLSPDGSVALAGYGNGTVRLWETANGQRRWQQRQHRGPVAAVALSSCGRLALSADHGPYRSATHGSIRLWDGATGQAKGKVSGLATRLAIAFDAQVAVRCERDAEACVWDLASAQITHRLERAADVALSADGRWALTAGPAGLRLWQLNWQRRVHEKAAWNAAAQPWLTAFLRRQTPVEADGFSRAGQPRWTETDIDRLMAELGWAGFGWLERPGVVRELERQIRGFR